jgi:YHS domain-containing protein
MGGLLTLLLFAGLFYFMMRFGCGAHAVHGHGGGQGGHAGHSGSAGHAGHGGRQEVTGPIDPVCGMEVAAGQGYTVTHAGREYRLCSRSCLDKFEANPDQYASVHGGAQ